MKCIKNKITNEIARVSNEDAQSKVNTRNWHYCPKHEYKAYCQHIIIEREYDNQFETDKII